VEKHPMTGYKKRQRESANKPISKKHFLKIALLIVIAPSLLLVLRFFQEKWQHADIVVYHTKKCQCVNDWIKHVRADGLSVLVHRVRFIEAIRKKYNIPSEFASCHTAIIQNYFIEGHVSSEVVNALRLKKPDIAGVALIDKTSEAKINGGALTSTIITFDRDGNRGLFMSNITDE
jgi:hypothetical protein